MPMNIQIAVQHLHRYGSIEIHQQDKFYEVVGHIISLSLTDHPRRGILVGRLDAGGVRLTVVSA